MEMIQRHRMFLMYRTTANFVQSSIRMASGQRNHPTIRLDRSESSSNLIVLLLIVTGVGVLHTLGVQVFFWQEPIRAPSPKPQLVEVSTISIPSPKSESQQERAPSLSEAKPRRKKVQRKPKLKKQNLSAQGIAFSSEEQALLQQLVRDFDMRRFAIENPDRPTEAQSQVYKEAYLDAAYDHNPKPDYPGIARSRGWQGKVILRVQITEQGKVESVTIEKSSKHDLLDESALEAVKKWLFVPAMRGEKPVATSVLVPIIFSMQNDDFAY